MLDKNSIIICNYASTLGTLVLGALNDRLVLCFWKSEEVWLRMLRYMHKLSPEPPEEGSSAVIETAILQLGEYISGKRRQFDIPLLTAGTPFQQKVWREISNIPYGTTASYSHLAASIGNPRAVRAVAGAASANPLNIFIPCHRIIGADGSLTGYQGGIEIKKKLLFDIES